MRPTPRLRFIERYIQINDDLTKVRILQQWWESNLSINLGWTGDIPIGNAEGEWRDVPTEKENT